MESYKHNWTCCKVTLRGFPYLLPYLLFWWETYPQTFSSEFLSICEYNSWKKLHVTDLSKMDILWGFVWRKWWTINMAQEIYIQAIIRWERMLNALQINQKKIYLIDLSIEQSTKIWRFQKTAGRFCIWSLPEYCSSALPAHVYKMVISTVCVQIDNCFCNMWIDVHQHASLRWFRGTLLSVI